MSYETLLSSLGFSQDPFASWDADAEDRLESYFIEPPFFKAVHGEPTHPVAAVVFAPRGGGKTALRRMIEIQSAAEDLICVTYSDFPTSGLALNQATLDYHLQNIIVLVLIGVISNIIASNKATSLSQHSK